MILNGNVKGNEEGEWTYVRGKKGTVIDYVLGNEETWESIKSMRIEDRVDSDHQPITMWVDKDGISVEGRRKRKRRKGGRRGVEDKGGIEEGRRKFEEYFGRKNEG